MQVFTRIDYDYLLPVGLAPTKSHHEWSCDRIALRVIESCLSLVFTSSAQAQSRVRLGDVKRFSRPIQHSTLEGQEALMANSGLKLRHM